MNIQHRNGPLSGIYFCAHTTPDGDYIEEKIVIYSTTENLYYEKVWIALHEMGHHTNKDKGCKNMTPDVKWVHEVKAWRWARQCLKDTDNRILESFYDSARYALGTYGFNFRTRLTIKQLLEKKS